MKPILFNSNETLFTSRGIGTLTDALSCVVTEERNNIYELEMDYPVTGIHAEEIDYAKFIYASPADGKAPQPFRIYFISKPLNGVFSVRAEHLSYDLIQIPVAPFTASTPNNALQGVKLNSVVSNPFTFETDKTNTSSFEQTVPRTARELLGGVEGSILDQFGGEYEFDKLRVILHSARGTNSGVTLRYGKNITDIEQDTSISETITGILPYWTGQFTDEDTKEQYMETVVGDVQYASNANLFPTQRIEIVDVSSLISAEYTEEVTTETGTEINTIEVRVPSKNLVNQVGQGVLDEKSYVGVPKVSLDISFVALWQTEEYKDVAALEHVNLCDIVTVYFEALGISTSAKVVKTVYDVLKERYDSISLGDVKDRISTIVTQEKKIIGALVEDGARRKTRLQVLDGMIEAEAYERLNANEVFDAYFQMTPAELALEMLERHGTTDSFASSITANSRAITQEVTDRQNGDANAISQIRQTAHSIDMTVNNGASTAGISISVKDADGNEIDTASGNIAMDGLVTFTNSSDPNNPYATDSAAQGYASSAQSTAESYADGVASTAQSNAQSYAAGQASSAYSNAVSAVNTALANGSTTVNGSCITTGTINAALANIININASNINTGTLTGVVLKSTNSSNEKVEISNGSVLLGYGNTVTQTGMIKGDSAGMAIIAGGISFSSGGYAVYTDRFHTEKLMPHFQCKLLNGVYFQITNPSSVNLFRCFNDSSGNGVQSECWYSRTYSSGTNAYITSAGTLGRNTSSSRRYKNHITYLDDLLKDEVIESARALKPCLFRYNPGYVTGEEYDGSKYNDGRYQLGLIAEDVEDSIGNYATTYYYDKKKDETLVENWIDRAVLTAVLQLAQDNADRLDEKDQIIKAQEDKIKELESKLNYMEYRLSAIEQRLSNQ